MVKEAKATGAAAPKSYSVPALTKALDVLELLSEQANSMSQAEICRALGRSASEIFRVLSALEARRYIRRTQGGQYRLTLRLFELSRTHSPYEELLRVALPVMRNLSEDLRETCHLTTLRDGEVVVLAQHESPKPVRLSVEVGSRHSPLATVSGRILLSAMEEDERRGFLSDYTGFDARPEEERLSFLSRVEAVRARGFETAEGERFVGGVDVGVLIGTPQGQIRAALIVALLRGPVAPDVAAIAEAVRRAGATIADRLGLG